MATNPETQLTSLFNVKRINEILGQPASKVVFNKKDIVIYTENKSTRSSAFENFDKAAKKLINNSKSLVKSYHIKTPSSKSSLGVFQFFIDKNKRQKAIEGDIYFKPIINKGSGGKLFEEELTKDLNSYFGGVPSKELRHGDTIASLFSNKTFISQYGFNKNNLSMFMAKAVGSANTKRKASISNGVLELNPNEGSSVSDVNITIKGTQETKVFCSLKFSSSYYIYNGSMKDLFESSQRTRDEAYKYFGLSGIGMAGFGAQFRSSTPTPKDFTKVKQNISNVIKLALGQEVTLINKYGPSANDIDVILKGFTSDVSINGNLEYIYPEAGKRKYAAIKFVALINNDKYKVECQFRGTTEGALTPRYLRINLKKI